jgi:hypothetical protein
MEIEWKLFMRDQSFKIICDNVEKIVFFRMNFMWKAKQQWWGEEKEIVGLDVLYFLRNFSPSMFNRKWFLVNVKKNEVIMDSWTI